MTKKQQAMVNSYKYSLERYGQRTELWQVYGKFSQRKQNALDDCKSLQNRLDGYNGTIVSHSDHFFTYAFKYADYNTGKTCLCYCTHANDYKFPID